MMKQDAVVTRSLRKGEPACWIRYVDEPRVQIQIPLREYTQKVCLRNVTQHVAMKSWGYTLDHTKPTPHQNTLKDQLEYSYSSSL